MVQIGDLGPSLHLDLGETSLFDKSPDDRSAVDLALPVVVREVGECRDAERASG